MYEIQVHPSSQKATLLQLQSPIDPQTMIVGEFNNPLSRIDRSPRQQLNREMLELNGIIN